MSGYLLSKGDSFLGVLGWFWIGCVIDFVSKGFVGVFGFACVFLEDGCYLC